MPKLARSKPAFPARCKCGRWHGKLYHQVKNAPPACFVPRGAVSYDDTIHALPERADLSKPPHLCAECMRQIKESAA